MADEYTEGVSEETSDSPDSNTDVRERDELGRFGPGNRASRGRRRRKRPAADPGDEAAQRRRLVKMLSRPDGLRRLLPELLADAIEVAGDDDAPASSRAAILGALLRAALPEPSAEPEDSLQGICERAQALLKNNPALEAALRGAAEAAEQAEAQESALDAPAPAEPAAPPVTASDAPSSTPGPQGGTRGESVVVGIATQILRTQPAPEGLPPRPPSIVNPVVAEALRRHEQAAEQERRARERRTPACGGWEDLG